MSLYTIMLEHFFMCDCTPIILESILNGTLNSLVCEFPNKNIDKNHKDGNWIMCLQLPLINS